VIQYEDDEISTTSPKSGDLNWRSSKKIDLKHLLETVCSKESLFESLHGELVDELLIAGQFLLRKNYSQTIIQPLNESERSRAASV
jgi:hypothetical protein